MLRFQKALENAEVPSEYDDESFCIQDSIERNPEPIRTIVLNLDTAGSLRFPNTVGTGFSFQTFTDSTFVTESTGLVSVRINKDDALYQFPCVSGRGYNGSFYGLYLTWPAHPAGTRGRFQILKSKRLPWEIPVALGPRLLAPAGTPFASMTKPLVSSLSNIHITTNTNLSGNSVANPLKAKTVTIDAGVFLQSLNFCVAIWCDTLIINGNIQVTGNSGTDGSVGSCCCNSAGNGGNGGSGGGGAGYTNGLGTTAAGGAGGSGNNGANGSLGSGGGGGFPGLGGIGGGLGYVGPFSFPTGGNGGGAGVGAPGYGGGGDGASILSQSASPAQTNVGGGGGGGGLITMTARIVISPSGVGGCSSQGGNGGNMGAGGTATIISAFGGGGGSIDMYAQKFDNNVNFSCQQGFGGDGSANNGVAGNFRLTEINHDGTSLGPVHLNSTAAWDHT